MMRVVGRGAQVGGLGWLVAVWFGLGAVAIGATASSMVMGGARVEAAARRASDWVAGYGRLTDGDFERTVFPVVGTLAGTEVTGAPVACGAVVTGIELQDGVPVVAWQRAHGRCAGTRLRRPGGAAALPPGMVATGPMVAVELRTGWARAGMQEPGYAVAFAFPPDGALPVVVQR